MSNKATFNGVIERATIKQFRKFHNVEIPCGRKLTVIIGQNGTQKTTLLGLLAQPFSMSKTKSKTVKDSNVVDSSFEEFQTITGHKFESKFADKFKLDKEKESVGEHEYSLHMMDKTLGDSGVFTIQSIKRDSSGKLRMWKKNARSAGDGYMHFPVIYLSLKRVTPIGEETKIKSTNIELTPEEFAFLKDNYISILNLFTNEYEANKLSSPNKKILIAHPNNYSALTVSAGQDNLGSILTAILSFKRLKESFPSRYNGGLLFIDEVESTLYPASQENLVKKLFRYASDYNIQIFVTTHSQSIIDTALKKEYSSDCRVLYLKSLDEKRIEVDSNLTAKQIHAHLTLKPCSASVHISPPKLRVYSEDEEARLFLNSLLPSKYKKLVSIINVNIGANELIGLRDKKIDEFTKNLLLLDGDQIAPKSKNIIILPGTCGPDKLLFTFLNDLPESSEFWPDNHFTGTYSKQICFKNHPYKTKFPEEGAARKYYKSWMREQLENTYWDKNGLKAFNFWKQKHPEEVQQFVSTFVKSYNFLAKKKGFPTIS